jgi:hypothetical protein
MFGYSGTVKRDRARPTDFILGKSLRFALQKSAKRSAACESEPPRPSKVAVFQDKRRDRTEAHRTDSSHRLRLHCSKDQVLRAQTRP